MATSAQTAGSALDRIRLPDGFRISLFTAAVPGARSLALGDGGTVFVGTRGEGVVYAVTDADGDGAAEGVRIVASGLNLPNGVAVKDGALYVAEMHRVLRFDEVESDTRPSAPPVVVYDGFPREPVHGWRFIGFGPDGLLYVPVGAPCNACVSDDPIFATITRLPPDGSAAPEIIASGVRNTVGFDWNPRGGKLWFTDNGRDQLGDDIPPDELNVVDQAGQHFGFPGCHGLDVVDPELGDATACAGTQRPAIALGPHVAALGMRFYRGAMFPRHYRGHVFIAEHGSWNRSTPVGYRVSLVRVAHGEAISYEPFADGWLDGADAWGRPVDVLVTSDGALLVSDDLAGAIYRITYESAVVDPPVDPPDPPGCPQECPDDGDACTVATCDGGACGAPVKAPPAAPGDLACHTANLRASLDVSEPAKRVLKLQKLIDLAERKLANAATAVAAPVCRRQLRGVVRTARRLARRADALGRRGALGPADIAEAIAGEASELRERARPELCET